jgi:hypothetical protein
MQATWSWVKVISRSFEMKHEIGVHNEREKCYLLMADVRVRTQHVDGIRDVPLVCLLGGVLF